MKGDKLVIQEGHLKAGRQIAELVFSEFGETDSKFSISIAGESGSGKSEIASVLSDSLLEEDIRSVILQQDDYFLYPPKSNAAMRRKDIKHVGLSEVRLDLLDQNLQDILDGKTEIEKPLVIFDEDRIVQETIELAHIEVVIVEGTYTTVLRNIHKRVFIDRTYVETRESRRRRSREKQDEFLEKILKIEHSIIANHKRLADLIVTEDYGIEINEQ